MGLEQLVEDVLLSDVQLSADDTTVVHTKDGVDVLHALCSDISELLDLGGGILDLRESKKTGKERFLD